MPKCGSCVDKGGRNVAIFKAPTLTNDGGGFTENYVPQFTRTIWIKTQTPNEIVQQSIPLGTAVYSIMLRYDTNAMNVKSDWKIVITTMNNLILNIRGPAVNVDGSNHWVKVIGVQED